MNMPKAGFTLLEILIVIIIIGILVSLGLPNFGPIREKTLDKEAKANLRLIQAAEKIYRLENGHYFPCSTCGMVPTNANINTYLRLSIRDTSPNWNYTTQSSGNAEATRPTDSRKWCLQIGQDEPATGACP